MELRRVRHRQRIPRGFQRPNHQHILLAKDLCSRSGSRGIPHSRQLGSRDLSWVGCIVWMAAHFGPKSPCGPRAPSGIGVSSPGTSPTPAARGRGICASCLVPHLPGVSASSSPPPSSGPPQRQKPPEKILKEAASVRWTDSRSPMRRWKCAKPSAMALGPTFSTCSISQPRTILNP